MGTGAWRDIIGGAVTTWLIVQLLALYRDSAHSGNPELLGQVCAMQRLLANTVQRDNQH